MVRAVARCGFDGVFVDNGCSQRSTSAAALAAFRSWLAARYTAEQARALLGVEDLAGVAFPARNEGTPALRVEQWRFWCETIRDQMAAIRQAGSVVLGRDFVVFPNGGRPHYIQEGLRDCDFVMFEKTHGTHGTHPGTVVAPVFEGVSLNSINDNIYEYRVVQSMRERVRPIILSRPGYPRSQPWLRLNPDAGRLAMAECAAFSGGGGFLFRPQFDVYHDVLNEYRGFLEGNPDLFAGMLPVADVGVLAGLEEHERGNPEHTEGLRALTRLLGDAHVLFEFLPERRQRADQLGSYSTLVACGLTHLCDERLAAVEGFVAAGGSLLVAGPFATHDEYGRERATPFAARIAGLAPGAVSRQGRGIVRRFATMAELPGGLPRVELACGVPKLAPGIRVVAWQPPERDRLVLHLVNYHVRLGVLPPPTPSAGPVAVTLPVPFAVRTATLHAPGQAPQALSCRFAEGRASCELPELGIHAVVEFR